MNCLVCNKTVSVEDYHIDCRVHSSCAEGGIVAISGEQSRQLRKILNWLIEQNSEFRKNNINWQPIKNVDFRESLKALGEI